jgi:glycosyltransferase involved in cell wall biosynthesis
MLKIKTKLVFIGSDSFAFLNFRGELIKKLIALNYDIFAILPPSSSEIDFEIKRLGVNVEYVQLNRRSINFISDILYLIKIFLILKKIKPAIIISFFIKPIIYGMLASSLINIPRRIALIEGLGSVYTAEIISRNYKRRSLKYLVNLLYKFSLYFATDVIFLNEIDKIEFQKLKIISVDKGVVFGPIGVNLSTWCRQSSYPKQITFLMACRLIEEKGVLEFLKASKLLKKIYPNVRFILAGAIEHGTNAVNIKVILKSVNDGDIEWLGHVNIKSWMDSSSVFILPTYYREGVPRSIQEAAAMSMAVITCEVPGCLDVVIPGITGFFVKPQDPNDLADKMSNFCLNPNLVLELGKNSRLLSERLFCVSKFNNKFVNLIGE